MESLSDLSDPHPQLAFVCEGNPNSNAAAQNLEVSTVDLGVSFVGNLPSGYVKIAIETWPFIVDFTHWNGDFP